MRTETALSAIQQRIERHDALALPWIRLWRRMGYGPDMIAQLLEAERVQPPRSKWSANAVRRIGERRGVTWRGMRSFVRQGVEAGRKAAARESLPGPLQKCGPREGGAGVVSTGGAGTDDAGNAAPCKAETLVFRHNGQLTA